MGGIDHQFQADLIDVRNLKKANDGFVYLLTCIDVLSKYAWVVPLKNKTGPSLVEAFEHIFAQGRKPFRLHTDRGTEFRKKIFQHFLKEKGVDIFVTQNEDIKASIVERFNRTLKEKMWRCFTKKNNLRYVEVLQQMVRAYNRSYHRSIKKAPADVYTTNQEEVWQTLYGQPPDTFNKQLHHRHHHQSLNYEGRWDTTDDFATSFLHFSLFSTALWDLPNSRPVHSLMLSSHLFLCPPCLLLPFTVPCNMVLARPDERET